MVTSSLKDQLQQPLIGFIVTLSFTFASHRSTRLVSLRDVDFIVTMSPYCLQYWLVLQSQTPGFGLMLT